VLDYEKYNDMLSAYYKKRGWDERGVPKQSTLERLGLAEEAKQLDSYVKL
jgi:aldehyde:ferredoxin oxidoreductase